MWYSRWYRCSGAAVGGTSVCDTVVNRGTISGISVSDWRL